VPLDLVVFGEKNISAGEGSRVCFWTWSFSGGNIFRAAATAVGVSHRQSGTTGVLARALRPRWYSSRAVIATAREVEKAGEGNRPGRGG